MNQAKLDWSELLSFGALMTAVATGLAVGSIVFAVFNGFAGPSFSEAILIVAFATYAAFFFLYLPLLLLGFILIFPTIWLTVKFSLLTFWRAAVAGGTMALMVVILLLISGEATWDKSAMSLIAAALAGGGMGGATYFKTVERRLRHLQHQQRP